MNKSVSFLSISLLAASLIIPAARGHANDDRRDNRSVGEDLRQDDNSLSR
jgi:hypothetical protein